jgi:hypothetical protein
MAQPNGSATRRTRLALRVGGVGAVTQSVGKYKRVVHAGATRVAREQVVAVKRVLGINGPFLGRRITVYRKSPAFQCVLRFSRREPEGGSPQSI